MEADKGYGLFQFWVMVISYESLRCIGTRLVCMHWAVFVQFLLVACHTALSIQNAG